MSETLTQILLALVTVAGTFTTGLFTYLRQRDIKRLESVEESLAEHKVKLKASEETNETFKKMIYNLEYEKSGLKARLEVVEKQKEEMAKTMTRLEAHEEYCNKELARLSRLLIHRTDTGDESMGEGKS